jgi:hypothetical protein
VAEVSRAQLAISAIAAVLGSGVISAAMNNFFLERHYDSVDLQTNMSLLVKINTSDLKDAPNRAAAFAGIMADHKMVDGDFACTILSTDLYAAKTDLEKLDVINSVRNATSEATINEHFANPKCDVASLGKKGDEIAGPTIQPPQIACPEGNLSLQIAQGNQVGVASELRRKLNDTLQRHAVTAPEVIANYDSENVVVRYFFKDQEDNAKHWQELLDATLGGTPDVKYAYIPGYEKSFGATEQQSFELWWPMRLALPDPTALKTVNCVLSAS